MAHHRAYTNLGYRWLTTRLLTHNLDADDSPRDLYQLGCRWLTNGLTHTTWMPIAHQRPYTILGCRWLTKGLIHRGTQLGCRLAHQRTYTHAHTHTHNSGAYGHQRTIHKQLGCRLAHQRTYTHNSDAANQRTYTHHLDADGSPADRRIHSTCMPMVSHGTYTLHQSRFHLTPAGIRDGNFVSVSTPAVLTSRSS